MSRNGNKQEGRVYELASGLKVNTKNSRQTWDSNDKNELDMIHRTRRGMYWQEFEDENGTARAKQLDGYDVEKWLMENGFDNDY